MTVFFHVRELALKPARFEVKLEPGTIDFLDPKVRQKGTLVASGKAELASELLGEIRLTGHLEVVMEADCDRCLEPAAHPLKEDFRLLYRPMGEQSSEEAELSGEEADIGFYEGNGVELNEALRESVLLAMPMQRLCREDCKGLCPVCGQNRNQQVCGCAAVPVDERWAALKGLK